MSNKDYIQYLFRKYSIKYEKKYKRIIIQKSILVKDLNKLRVLLNDIEINEIIVE